MVSGIIKVTCSEVKQWLDNSVRDTRRINTAVNAFDMSISHGENWCKIWLQIERKFLLCGGHNTHSGWGTCVENWATKYVSTSSKTYNKISFNILANVIFFYILNLLTATAKIKILYW